MMSFIERKANKVIDECQDSLESLRSAKRVALSKMYKRLEILLETKSRLGINVQQDPEIKKYIEDITKQAELYTNRESAIIRRINQYRNYVGVVQDETASTKRK